MSLQAAGHSEIEARFGTATGFQISAGNGAGACSSLVSSCQETQQQTKGVLGHPMATPPTPSTAFPLYGQRELQGISQLCQSYLKSWGKRGIWHKSVMCLNVEGSGSLAAECSIACVSPHVHWEPRLRLHVSCWSTEIVFSNRGARMLNFLEWFLCVLWICACGHGPSHRESLARHLRTPFAWHRPQLNFFQISTEDHSPHSPPEVWVVNLAVSS